MCLALIGIHCYLGLHVLARGVVFVDLALAQVAAFGVAFAYLLGFEHHDTITYFISLGSTLAVAFFLAYANRLRLRVSQEALIGIIYALASATIILLIDKMSHGSEHLKQSLIGQLLWVSWKDVIKVALIYSCVGAVHYFFRDQFYKSSFKGGARWIWDFLFYALFGVVITSSVQVAGVLLVFSFLIVPATLSSLFFTSLKSRLLFGWITGALLSLIGMVLSYTADLPSGAVIVVIFSITPFFVIPLYWKLHRFKKEPK